MPSQENSQTSNASDNGNDSSAKYAGEKTLNVGQAYDAACYFYYSLKDYAEKHFTENDFDDFCNFGSYLESDPAVEDDWRSVYLKHTNRELPKEPKDYPLDVYPSLDKEVISSISGFNIMCDLSEWYLIDPDFKLPQIVSMFQSMKTNPEDYKSQWELWREAVNEVQYEQ